MRNLFFALIAMALLTDSVSAASTKYFLTPQRLRRLKRDRERQTPRWLNFENRINTVKDSPERGLELALYHVITGDRLRGVEAITWTRDHPCAHRQGALVSNWVDPSVMSPIDHYNPPVVDCDQVNPVFPPIAKLRDTLIDTLHANKEPDPDSATQVIKALENGAYIHGADLYAAVEFFTLWREATRSDAREQSPQFFASLPTLLLLSMKPDAVERPGWQTHVAALALVSLDTNSTGAQFLQGWAIEDRQMLRDGPGMLYELLWADPYLPGVGYQNLDPWLFNDATGTLLARADWSPQSCWIRLAPAGSEDRNCPDNWKSQTAHFGHLSLMPFNGKCVDVTHPPNEFIILSNLPTGQKLRYDDGGEKKQTAVVNSPGLWRVPVNVNGKVCLAR